ncbi:PREDICTED: cyclin-dependent kinase 9-like [Dinoponera quadriceps]|uniref:Cyclin-dependent kinase 9-like n=1 Tax=Dinoponera quadriceps TaxID=609295 RepID=A0A6P3WN21_DINQU|nr:PREDICTED: cyclin-dependent kinase 9-like [Dinoponera quadriceps]XP_014467223.1 PREDICTED: cyclin-dependent kinase 9-like [Dinoponera quadriceps]
MDSLMYKKENETYVQQFNFPFCDELSKYEKIVKIGQGTFGEVFKAKDKDNKKFAIKRIQMECESQGFPLTALREIKLLQVLSHKNIVKLIEICRTTATEENKYCASFYLIFEFCDHDLSGLLSNVKVKFSLGEIKTVMQQILNGIYYIHCNKIVHRDVKASNILVTKKGVVKIADFGLARALSVKVSAYTNKVVTLWYRPPELLLGEKNYGPSVDLWSVGCVMAEMWTRSPIMQGNSEQNQLVLISNLCGSITSEVWPDVEKLDLFKTLVDLPKEQTRKVKDKLMPYLKDEHAYDLLDKLLTLDPNKRIDADESLHHDFFWTDPMPCDLANMLEQHHQSMFEYFARQKQSSNTHQPQISPSDETPGPCTPTTDRK